ncbi:oligosaccharide flippase family protein [Methylobacterium brachythecii]|uniref:O-antigen/teichoic acid export membrane protein n=1 Tax=Methylobacterium brachythecii TaxID=1176177 RepID=A0A7W6AGL2_9HYPH|nr:oligosaccharide flippase family protein [Methylobacterium brachythecii]MBB3900661.1 O-antigen/teichoic acid export membrane protein [Methylobacterium brachythecii]GLS43538.1 polysaccharide biosynthesis-like protein [Methylobacterium brachythecii]
MAAGLTVDAAFGAALGRLKAVRSGAGFSAASVFAVRIAAAGFAYIAQVLMARMMGGAEYGIFAAVWVWIAILGHSATLGLSQGACRFMPADEALGRHAEVRGFLAGGAAASMAGGLILSLVGLLMLKAEGSLLASPYGAPIVLGALVLPLFAFQDYLEGVARSRNWAVLAIAPPYLLRQGLIMAAMILAVLLGAPAKASVAVSCTLFATAIAVIVQAALLLKRLGPPALTGSRRYHWREWLTACLPIAAGDLATAAFGFVDVVLLGFLTSPASVGLYFAATRIQQFVVFVHYAASAATAQRFTAAKARGDLAGLNALVRDQARWVLGATALVGAGTVIMAPLLLGLFGPEFRESLPVLTVLVIGSVGASLFGPGEDLLTMLGGERLCAGITVAMLAIGAGLCFVLVPWLGLIGAALAMAAMTILRAAAMALGARAIHGIATPAFSDFFMHRTRR